MNHHVLTSLLFSKTFSFDSDPKSLQVITITINRYFEDAHITVQSCHQSALVIHNSHTNSAVRSYSLK